MLLDVTLPFPPSVNRLYRNIRGRTLISRQGREYRTQVCGLLARGHGGIRKPPAGGRIALCMDAFPPDRRARDLDNLQKGLLDSMQHAGVYQNDSQIDLLLARRGPVAHGGYVRVQVQSLPLVICPVCGRYDPPQVAAN